MNDEYIEQKRNLILTEPVGRLIMKFAFPSVLTMLVTSLYNMADALFVSMIGTSASGAVGIVFSLMSLFQAFAFMIGQGSANNMAHQLGSDKLNEAMKYVSICFFLEVIIGTFFALSGQLVLNRLVYILGATETIAPYAVDYCRWILVGAPFIMASLGMNNLLRSQGLSSYGAIGIASGGILNIVFDAVAIFILKLGIAGAGLATAFSQFISFILLICITNNVKGCVRISIKSFSIRRDYLLNIIKVGMPSLATQGVRSISSVAINHLCQPYGDACIAAYSIVNKYIGILYSTSIGIGHGFQPVCGQNYGAKKYKRVLDAYSFLVRTELIFLLVVAATSFFCAENIISVFRIHDPKVMEIAIPFLKYQALTLPLVTFISSGTMFTQTIGYGLRSTLIACLRNGICFVPVVFALDYFFGLRGLQWSQALSDVLSAVIAVFVVSGIREILRKEIE